MKPTALKLLLVTVIFSISVILFLVITHELFSDKEYDFDNWTLSYLANHGPSRQVTSCMAVISFFASSNFLASCYICLFVYNAVIKKRLTPGFYILSTGISGFLVNFLLKWFFRRQRPADPLVEPLRDFSFPSGHSSAAFIFYGLLIYLLWRTRLQTWLKYFLSILLVLLSIAIGFSRMYLRVHYATDVLAGFCIGTAWLTLSFALYGKLNGNTP
jgi:membrane-associated phospholipid phosphatase